MGKKLHLNDLEHQPANCWTRVVGYFRPTSEFNIGKSSEFFERKWFLELSEKGVNRESVFAK